MHRATWLLALAVALPACGGGVPADGASDLRIAVTTSILGDLVTDLVAEDATVDVLLPPGIDPHDHQASAQEIAALRDADLLIANGLGLEASLEDALTAAAADGVPLLEVAPQLDPQPFGSGEGLDPHVWLDPVRMVQAVEAIAAEIAEVDDALPDDQWRDRGAALADDLRRTHDEVTALLEPIAATDRILVTNHESFGYFARRYGFEVLGVLIGGGSSVAQPSAGDLSRLADVVRDAGVAAIFTETTASPRLAETLAEAVGRPVAVVTLYSDSLGDAGSPADSYAGMLLEDARLIADALTGAG